MNTIFSKFPFIRYCFALIGGISICLITRIEVPQIIWLLLILGLLYICSFFFSKTKLRSFQGFFGLIFLFTFGYFNAFNALNINDLSHILKANSYNFYRAEIVSLVEEKPKTYKAMAKVKAICKNDIWQISAGKIILYLDKQTIQKPNFGDNFLIKGRPQLVEGPKNPYEFNYKEYLQFQGIYHQQYLRDTSFAFIYASKKVSLTSLSIKINNYCDSVFTKYISNKTGLAVLNAMVLGLRDDIDNDLLQAYSAAGAIHVLSVSGLHVGVIYIILIWAFGFLKKTGNFGEWTFFFIILCILWLYAAITGFSAPVLRSTFMFSIILLSKTAERQDNSYNTLAISAFCLLVFNPLLVTNIGFLLSYLAVIGMIQIQPLLNPIIIIDKRKSILNWIADRLWKVTTVAIAAQVATLPITIYYFHQFPNYFLLANPIVILLSSIVLIGGLAFLLLVSVFNFIDLIIINEWLGTILQFFVKALNYTVLYTENLPGAVSKYLNYSKPEMALMYILIIAILAFIQTHKYLWIQISLISSALLIGFFINNQYHVKNQEIICLHSIPNGTGVSVISGNKVTLFADSTLINDRKNINYRLNNFWAISGIYDTTKVMLSEGSHIYNWKGKSFLFLNHKLKDNQQYAKMKVDYLVIKNKKLHYFEDIKNKIDFKNLIIDSSISSFYSTRFQNEAAKDGVYAYSLFKEGSLML